MVEDLQGTQSGARSTRSGRKVGEGEDEGTASRRSNPGPSDGEVALERGRAEFPPRSWTRGWTGDRPQGRSRTIAKAASFHAIIRIARKGRWVCLWRCRARRRGPSAVDCWRGTRVEWRFRRLRRGAFRVEAGRFRFSWLGSFLSILRRIVVLILAAKRAFDREFVELAIIIDRADELFASFGGFAMAGLKPKTAFAGRSFGIKLDVRLGFRSRTDAIECLSDEFLGSFSDGFVFFRDHCFWPGCVSMILLLTRAGGLTPSLKTLTTIPTGLSPLTDQSFSMISVPE